MKTRTTFGVIATLAWLGACGFYVYSKGWDTIVSMELNAVGDFIAGTVSPIAFLWLILGYFQQGEELQQNTFALKMQADQLRLAVDEYKQLVAATSRQASLLETEHKERREQELRESALDLVSDGPALKYINKNGLHGCDQVFTNIGADVRDLSVTSTLPYLVATAPIQHLEHGGRIVISMELEERTDDRGGVEIHYYDGYGRPRRFFMFVTISGVSARYSFRTMQY